MRLLVVLFFFCLCCSTFASSAPTPSEQGIGAEASLPDPKTLTTIEQCQNAAKDAWHQKKSGHAFKYYSRAVELGLDQTWEDFLKALGLWHEATPTIVATPVAHHHRHAKGPINEPLVRSNPIPQLEASKQMSLTATPTPVYQPIGQLSFGLQGDTWTSNYDTSTNGWELWMPLSFSIAPAKDILLYAQTEIATGGYTAQDASELDLTNIADTSVGGELGFKTLGLNSVLNVSANIPTGNPAWETSTQSSNLPQELADDRYQSRGFGFSGSYSLSVPVDSSKMALSAGYQYSGNYNPYFNTPNPSQDLKLGDSYFFNVNRVTLISPNRWEIIKAGANFFLPTQQNGVNTSWGGPNLNVSYGWSDRTAFTFELGALVFLPGQTWDNTNGVWVADSGMAYGPRTYLSASYAWGAFVLAGRAKFIWANEYTLNPDSLHGADSGGYSLGLQPSYSFGLGGGASLRIWVAYDWMDHLKGGTDSQGNIFDAQYSLYTLGMSYSVPF